MRRLSPNWFEGPVVNNPMLTTLGDYLCSCVYDTGTRVLKWALGKTDHLGVGAGWTHKDIRNSISWNRRWLNRSLWGEIWRKGTAVKNILLSDDGWRCFCPNVVDAVRCVACNVCNWLLGCGIVRVDSLWDSGTLQNVNLGHKLKGSPCARLHWRAQLGPRGVLRSHGADGGWNDTMTVWPTLLYWCCIWSCNNYEHIWSDYC